jgi:ATP-binding cassette subfamily F protein 3
VLAASGLTKRFGDRVLFRDLSLRMLAGRRQALIGGNGTGKTTLLEILLGQQEPDEGEVHRPRDAKVGYLAQELPGSQGGSVLEEVLGGAGSVRQLAEEIATLEHRVAATTGADHDRALSALGAAQTRFEQMGGYALEAEAHRILDGLGFDPADHGRPVTDLSGGWRMRVALARLLLSNPDALILDEPTNHLDVDSVAWLEGYLGAWPGALLFVSHDRDFIDAVANRVLELVPGEGLVEYAGNFGDFVIQREDRIAQAEAQAASQARRVAHMERFVERFRYKATKARQVQSRIKQLDKIEAIKVPERAVLKTRFAFPEPQRSSRVVVEVHDADVGYEGGRTVLRDVSFVIERGRKVGLVGPNGAGKTTLLRLILGQLSPTKGDVSIGANVDVARFDQDQTAVLDPAKTVFDEFRRSASDRAGRNLRTVLGSFGFSGDAADRRVGDLSGGERTRLALGKTMVDPVNLLVLDEPTNHLDLPSCDVLEDALHAYPGTVLLVTHDRHLIRSVSDCLLVVRGGTARWYEGVDEDLLAPGAAVAAPGARTAGKPAARTAGRPRGGAAGKSAGGAPSPGGTKSGPLRAASGGLPAAPAARPAVGSAARDQRDAQKAQQRDTRKLRRDLDNAEKAWERAEAEVADLQRQLAEPDVYGDAEKVKQLVAGHDEAKDRAAAAMAAWELAATALERAERA